MAVAVAPTVAVAVASACDIRVAPTSTSAEAGAISSPTTTAAVAGMHGRIMQDACAATIAFIHRTLALIKRTLLSGINEEMPIHIPNHS